ncbi:MAG: hypothetical protein R3B84_10375 [Zavarzinella sp.]
MTEDRGGSQRFPAWKKPQASWTSIFRTFLVALNPGKLFVAAIGILVTALGWWLLSVIFYHSWSVPDREKVASSYKEVPDGQDAEKLRAERLVKIEKDYQERLATWAMMYEMAGPTNRGNQDATKRYVEWYLSQHPDSKSMNYDLAKGFGGRYRYMPWADDRGPNPFYVMKSTVTGTYEQRQSVFVWFLGGQVPNLMEPLVKMVTPVVYCFDSRASFWVYIYLAGLVTWLLVVWAFFGGIITRMAVLQLSHKDVGGIKEAVRYVRKRYISYLLSPALPFGLILFVLICCILFGVLHWIPLLGDLIDGLLWFLPLAGGLAITLLFLGLVGYPLMYPTLSTEGSDTFDAFSRSYNYVYESPWHYAWYCLCALVYGAVLVFFVVLVGSLTAFFAKWGVSKFPAWGADRSPEYLCVYTPESLGWKQLLTEGSPAAINDDGEYINPEAAKAYMKDFAWYNHMGAGMVGFWITLVFMLTIGFSYSYFWTAATQVYLLMRKRVDETDMDEVYIDDEPLDPPPAAPAPLPNPPTPAPAPAPAPVEQFVVASSAPAPSTVPDVSSTPASVPETPAAPADEIAPPAPAPVEPTPEPKPTDPTPPAGGDSTAPK